MRRRLFRCTAQERQLITRALTTALEGQPAVLFAYVHGSFIQDRPFHDVDVGVYLTGVEASGTSVFALDLAAELETQVSDALAARDASRECGPAIPVDARVLNQAPLGFRFYVYQGQLLFRRDADVHGQEVARTALRYLDLKPLRDRAIKEAMTAWRST
jgi:predicted nucleotidyltransferase